MQDGPAGAWVFGRVLADENPLYDGANFNGTDDTFARQILGALLPPNAVMLPRRQLAHDWSAAQRAQAPPAGFVNRPLPDYVVAGTRARGVVGWALAG